MKTERGVMIVKDGKAWGKTWEDGYSTSYGWMDIEDATIYDPQYMKDPTDATYKGSAFGDTGYESPYINELRAGKIVPVTRRTEVIIEPDSQP